MLLLLESLDEDTSALFCGTSLQLETEFVSCDLSFPGGDSSCQLFLKSGLGWQGNTEACY